MSGPVSGAHPPHLAVREAVARALAEDLLPLGDLTAALLPSVGARAALVAREAGVLAGRSCATEAFLQVDPALGLEWAADDGDAVEPGQVLASIEGPLASLASAERTALNFLCHLSGVASLTRAYVSAAAAASPSVRICDTRKTTPGLRALEKAAVRAGGGVNHRGSLSEGVLVKDNHLGGIGIAGAVAAARAAWPGRLVEVECDRLDQVVEAVEAGATIVMCDNMSPEEVAQCVAAAADTPGRAQPAGPPPGRALSAGPPPGRALVEVSGRVSLATVAAYAATGADLISVGALTHSAPALDIGLDLEARPCC